VLTLFLTFLLAALPQAQQRAVKPTGVDSNLRGVSVAYDSPKSHKPVVWASGSKGVVLRSDDEGVTWQRLHVEGGEALDFRGIQAIDGKTAYLMSSGSGENSRIYKTTDGGITWQQQYTDKRQAFFLDAIQCMDDEHCFALSDPIDGKFLLLNTVDGEQWKEVPRDTMPPIIPSEGAFAASNSALFIYNKKEIYFGTGGGTAARVFHSRDLGKTWTAVEVPIAAGYASSGVFSVVRVRNYVIVVGGDYKDADTGTRSAAYSNNRGLNWHSASRPPGGYRSGVVYLGGSQLITVGPNGLDRSYDLGRTWVTFDSINLNAIASLDKKYAWVVGAKGAIDYLNTRFITVY
jgi:photosystem II stability/assembly factor-like uncharacterized protein